MNEHYMRYLEREHARLQAEICEEEKRPLPNDMLISRLKKLKLAIKDQMTAGSCHGAKRAAA